MTIEEKNVTMVADQPVCTTVVYENTRDKEGKEGVYQIPTKLTRAGALRWNTYDDDYAARNKVFLFYSCYHIISYSMSCHVMSRHVNTPSDTPSNTPSDTPSTTSSDLR